MGFIEKEMLMCAVLIFVTDGYQIAECGSDGEVVLYEDSPNVLTCTGITDDVMKWEVNRSIHVTFTAATCTLSLSFCAVSFGSFQAGTGPGHNTTTLTVTPRDKTSISGAISCGGLQMGSGSTTCKVRVVRKPSVSIRNCDNNFLDIRENRVTSIYCEGFDSSATIEWSVKRGTNPNEPVATCTTSKCTIHEPVQFDARRKDNESELTYLQNDRDQDKKASILCADATTNASCTLNLISWAVLTNCFLAYNSRKQILQGSCNFEKAFSNSKDMSCTWIQNGKVTFPGKVWRTFVALKYTKGKCTFSLKVLQNWTPGKHNYTVLFYPSGGEQLVTEGNIAPPTTTTTTTTTMSTTTTTKKPEMISLTTSFDGENDGSPIKLQRGQKAFLLTCRYDNTTGSAGHVSWCRTGSTCNEQSGSADTTSECPDGSSRLCRTRNTTCAENIGQEVVTQSCEGSEPCGVRLTIKKVSECDGGTYFCYVFPSVSTGNSEVASVTVSVKDCEDNTYGPECLDICGRCAGNQTCNTTTGHCLTCQAGWTPPFCTTAVPEKPLLTPTQTVVVGIAAGAPLSWGFIATLVQVCQVLGNAGWMPFLSLGGKDENEEGKGKNVSDSFEEEEPPSKCSRFLNCIFCGGAGMCLLSLLFCISRGKLMSNKFTWRKDAIKNDAELKVEDLESSLDHVITEQPELKSKDSTDVVTYPADSSEDIQDGQNKSLDSLEESKDEEKFTSQYFEKMSWLENPYQHRAQARQEKALVKSYPSVWRVHSKNKAKYQTEESKDEQL